MDKATQFFGFFPPAGECSYGRVRRRRFSSGAAACSGRAAAADIIFAVTGW